MNEALYRLPQVLSSLRQAKSALLISHVSPDGDTLGSALALKIRLERLGCRVTAVVDGIIPNSYLCLPGIESFEPKEIDPSAFDTVVAIDVSSTDRMGKYLPVFEACGNSIVIDHHKTNPGFAKYNLIDGEAPAAAVVVFRLFEQMDMALTTDEAICLYAALSTDTGNFIYASTTAEAFSIMSKLMAAGLPLYQYSDILFQKREKEFLFLLGRALSTLRITGGGRIAGMTITRKDMADTGANKTHTDGIVNYARNINGVDLAYLLTEDEQKSLKLSLRSNPPFDVGTLAAQLGGGGHNQASGATLNMPMEEAIPFIEQKLSLLLQDV